MAAVDDLTREERAAVNGSLLRIATAGSVDDGKSTLIGRLLYDSKQIFEDTFEAITEASAGRGTEFDLSLITDGLRAEREQGITIDVAYRHFATPRRAFILADTPGHIRYTRNMVTGASTADLALVLVDARNGFVQQSRRHLFIASLLRIPHVIVCINKMDLVDYDESVFGAICAEIRAFASRLAIGDLSFIPISALEGDNVVEPSARMLWYGGPPLLYQLEHVQVTSDRNLIDVRLPVQWVIRPGAGEQHADYRGYAGKMASGVLRVGDEVRILPSGETSHIRSITNHDTPLQEAYPPLSVAVELTDDLDISRGDMICRPRNQPTVSRDIDAIVCWMAEEPSRPQGRYLIKHTANSTRGVIAEVIHRIDVDTLHRDESAEALALNEIGRVRLRTGTPLVFDPYDRNRRTGAFILIDEATNATVAAGMISGVAKSAPAGGTGAHQQSSNVVWEPSRMSREQRWAALGRVGATLWVTGLPAAGKSTIGDALEERLITSGIPAMRLDGDNLRHGLNGNLGFDPADRAENIRRAAHAARLLADAGTIAIVTVVSPYAASRQVAREIHESDGLTFIEVFFDTPLEECERRDPKGLYAKARAGEIVGMTGIDDAYEVPEHAEVTLRPADAPHAVDAIIKELVRRGICPAR
ncbi:MAG TPA: adenylyl-sulfate kinase [Solirubrobacteraceae bacterium]|nr:adenylyl-sulfate kinase [Solirubrobacteraceae bacterium]